MTPMILPPTPELALPSPGALGHTEGSENFAHWSSPAMIDSQTQALELARPLAIVMSGFVPVLYSR